MSRPACTDWELERRLLSALGSIGDVAADVANRLPAHDFSHPEHQALALDVYALADAGEPVNSVAVVKRAEKRGRSRQAMEILDADPVYGPEVQSAAAHLRTLARSRRLRDGFLAAVSACEAGEPDEALKLAGELDEPLGSVSGHRTGTAREAMERALVAISERKRIGADAMATGFPVIDHAIVGLRPRTMAVVGGATNAGKSQLLLAMALHMVRRRQIPVGIVSCEDEETVWGERLLADGAGISPTVIERGSAQDYDTVSAFAQAVENARGMGLHLAYSLNRPVADTLAAIRSLAAKGCRVVMVDYLQAIRLSAGQGRHDRAVANALQDVKGLCQELGLALVVASQFNRPEKSKPFAAPYLSSLKESGELENSAEIVVLLWKTGDDDDARTLGKVAKVKWSGRRPRFEIIRHPETGLIASVEQYVPQEQAPKAQRYGSYGGVS